jgi:hypothetical protein
VAAWRSYGAALLEQTRLPARGPCTPSLSSSALRVIGVGVRPKAASRWLELSGSAKGDQDSEQ